MSLRIVPLLSTAFLALLAIVCVQFYAFSADAANESLLSLPFEDLAGKPLTLESASQTGKKPQAYLVHYWATWCAPCIEELPQVLQLQKDYADSPLQLVVISMDGANAAPKILQFLKRQGLSELQTHVDPTMRGFQRLRGTGLPLSVLIDAQGKELWRDDGTVDWNTPKIQRMLKKYASEPV